MDPVKKTKKEVLLKIIIPAYKNNFDKL